MRKHLSRYCLFHKLTLAGMFTASLALPGTHLNAATQQQTYTLGGSIGDGPVVGANLLLLDRNNRLISNNTGNAFANYQLRVPAGTAYPVYIKAYHGTDLVTGRPLDITLKAAALTSTQTRSNLNPYSTLIVEIARTMADGLTPANVATATGIVVREMNFGLKTGSVPDPMRTAITAQNIANIVRASEALGEVIRRTRTALAQAGYTHGHNIIVRALAADLRDGRLDGRGTARTNARISATANAVSAQVLIEGLQNRLYVDGVLATGAMDNAIRTVMPAATLLTNSVDIPQAMLTQTRRLLNAVRQVDTRTQLAVLADIVNNIAAGSSTAAVRTKLTDAHSRLLNSTVTTVASASSTTLQTLNATVGAGTVQAADGNRAPAIGGTPQTSIVAGFAYRFIPTASDPDGNTLLFAITNKPAWARFDAATGTLTGTPMTAGTFGNISIRVSDGTLAKTLPAFTITVKPAPTANSAPTIGGIPPASVNTGSSYSFAPFATDKDGDGMSFSVANKPAWATFNTATGRLSGTPGEANVGSYGNIVIRVSDGKTGTALPAFSIRVNSTQTTARSLTLRWAPPRTRTDGSSISLSQISSYRIYYGTAPGSYPQRVAVSDGSTSHIFQGLAAGTYYFVVTAVDSGGRESGYSGVASTRVQ